MSDEQDLQRVAKRRVQARFGLVIHLVMYLAVNGGLFGMWWFTGHGYPWFLWPMIGWGVGIVAHAMALVIGPDSAREQRAIDRELQRLRMRPQPR
jgi:hypothetical protein